MSRFAAALCLALWLAAAQAIDTAPAFEDPALQARYEGIARELRCLQCRSETIADCLDRAVAHDDRRCAAWLLPGPIQQAARVDEDERVRSLRDGCAGGEREQGEYESHGPGIIMPPHEIVPRFYWLRCACGTPG